MSGFFWTFEVADDESYDRLARAVEALRAAKQTGDWQNFDFWRQVFTGSDIPWGSDALLESFQRGEFVLLGLRREDTGMSETELEDLVRCLREDGIEYPRRAFLDFEPFACPYSGDCMEWLIEAFGHRNVLPPAA